VKVQIRRSSAAVAAAVVMMMIFASEASDHSFANVSHHTADWALSRSKLRAYQRASLTMIPFVSFEK
jgi:hypothetical protein